MKGYEEILDNFFMNIADILPNLFNESYETVFENGSYHPNEVSVNEAKLNLR